MINFGCRLHGPTCDTPWGYDEQHTDQSYPYTLDQLAERDSCPHRYAYPTCEEYVEGFRLWRAIFWDGRPNREEAQVLLDGFIAAVAEMRRAEA
ncbi:hypothetical protein [Embleya sp. NPDC005971]|uniref:hypothetical protein n=1 Tax=Embleya sp. NPDC005971 TaxID=3156724 RepID=UPI00341028E9